MVFGRAAALRCSEVVKPGKISEELPKDAGQNSIERLDKFRNATGEVPTSELRLRYAKNYAK